MSKKTVNHPEEQHTCGECAECEPVTKFHTLSVHGKKPTMGSCPYEEFCVLLSQRACNQFLLAKAQEFASATLS